MANTTDFTNFSTEHPNYFPGQYLLEDDFELQHKYLSDRQRYHNQSLHVSGIIEGLGVEVVQGKKAVLIKPGSAIDGNGELIVVKKDITFSDFKNVNSGELYLQFSQEKQVKQQEDVADSYTRWVENPTLGFAVTTPKNGIKLAKLTISGDTITLDSNVREYSGLSLPNSNSQALTLRSGGNANPNLAVLTGSLKIDGDLTVNGTVQCSNGSVTDVLAIGDKPFVGNVGNVGGHRDWMKKGMKIFGDSDSLFIGLKDEGANRKDAVIAWGDDPDDNLRFIHAQSGGDVSGKEVMKLMSNGNLLVSGTITGNIDAANITGTLSVDRIPNLSAGKITTGVLAVERIPNLSADKITSGTLSIDRIPSLSAANAYQKAQFTLSGGGTVTWEGPGKRLKWTKRFIGISMERSTAFPSGYIDIIQPTTNIPAAQVYDEKERDTNADGVVLKDWEALYAVHTVGGNNTQVTFQIVRYTNNFNAPSNWLLVAVVNGDDSSVKLGTGTIIPVGGTYNTNGNLTVTGAITPSVGNTETDGIMFPKDPFGGSGDAAWIRYYRRGTTGEATTLEIGTANDADDHIALMPTNGNVGIGINNPAAKLDVNGHIFEKLDVIQCNNRDDWGSATHPIKVYFKNKLTGKPIGTMMRAIQDNPRWKGHYWQAWVDADGLIRVIHNSINTPHLADRNT